MFGGMRARDQRGWFGQVTVGIEHCIILARAPSVASARIVGISAFGSSKLIMGQAVYADEHDNAVAGGNATGRVGGGEDRGAEDKAEESGQ